MLPRLSRTQKLEYTARAREVTAAFSCQGYQDELSHVLQTYGPGLGAGVTRQAFIDFLASLPLRDDDAMLNAFTARQITIETEEVYLDKAIMYSEVNNSAFDNGLHDERDLDADVVEKAREEDRRLLGMNGRIATPADIAESAMDGVDLSWLKDAERKINRAIARIPPPIVLLTDGIVARCRDAMLPLTFGVCPNSVRRAFNQRVLRLRCLALEISIDADDDECLSR